MYKEFYGFTETPFNVTPDTRFFYPSKKHEEALAALLYTVQYRKGFAAITGNAGTGKTTVCRVLLKNLESHVKSVIITNTYITGKQLLALTLEQLGMPTNGASKIALLSRMKEYLTRALIEDSNVVLIIDEAQNLTPSALEEVRMLSNMENEKQKLLQILLIGQPKLRDRLGLADLSQLRQRINVCYHIDPLTYDETHGYVQYRLRTAGSAPQDVFTPEAVNAIYQYSQGVPRLINMVCDRSLLIGYVREKRPVTDDIVQEVECELGNGRYQRSAEES